MEKHYCDSCEEYVEPTIEKHVDCDDCLGTGIGYNHEPNSCGHCNGRGYHINPHYLCPDCDSYIAKVEQPDG
jgi:DnaJ-class molecular chaperone